MSSTTPVQTFVTQQSAGADAALAEAKERVVAEAPPEWPMPVAQFLAGPYMHRADVVLTRKHDSIRSWLIRWATHGSFSHAALVFLVPHMEEGFNNSFVIESAGGGVDLTNLADYLNDHRSVVGIKRLAAPWLGKEIQGLVRGRMLNSIKSRYSYATAINLALDFLNELAFGVKSRVVGQRKAISTRRARDIAPPNKFICSGLVQLGFVHAVAELVGQARLAPSRLADVVFHAELARFLPEDWEQFTDAEQLEIMWDFVSGFGDVMESVTPEDLAASPRLQWVYIVREGKVYPVLSDADARALLDWEPA